MKDFNVGIIGYGWVAEAHIAAINATAYACVSAVYSSRELNPTLLNEKHGGNIVVYSNLKKMLSNPEINVVSICSYPYDHAKQAIAAAQAGKHLIIEKPLALNWDDCLRVESAVKSAGVKTCICFECRFSDQLLKTKAVIDQGLLGEIHYGEVDYYHGIGPWYGQYRWNTKKDAGGSSLLSAGCHALDALLMFMGNEVETVSSYATSSKNKDFSPYEYPTSSVSILRFKGGQVGKVASVIDCLQPYYFHIHLVGSEGSLLDNKLYSTQMGGQDKEKWIELPMKMLDSGDVSDHPYQAQFEAFFRALSKGEEMPMTSLKDALYTHDVIFTADRSNNLNKPGKPELKKTLARK
jgi:predicted dehydrogenase